MAGNLKRGAVERVEPSSQIPARLASPALDRVIQAQIGDKLRAMYGDLVEQPVPDRLSAILAKLNASTERDS